MDQRAGEGGSPAIKKSLVTTHGICTPNPASTISGPLCPMAGSPSAAAIVGRATPAAYWPRNCSWIFLSVCCCVFYSQCNGSLFSKILSLLKIYIIFLMKIISLLNHNSGVNSNISQHRNCDLSSHCSLKGVFFCGETLTTFSMCVLCV